MGIIELQVTGPASYLTLDAGTPVQDRVGAPVGEVTRVLCHGDGSFDGLIVATQYGLRFVDAHEVRNIIGGTVILGVTHGEVEKGDPRRPNAPAAPRRGLRRLIGKAAERIPVASWGQTEASERDRDAVVDSLKRAFIADALTTDQLAEHVARAHGASTLEELEELLRQMGY